jgi:RNA polymerase sigma-70 factor (ECF subfamily)
MDQEIIVKAAQGDMGAFELIYRNYTNFVFNVALRIVRNRSDAEEIVQEVFLKLHSRLRSFRFESALKTWIYRVTVNMSINYVRKEKKQRENILKYAQDPAIDHKTNPEEQDQNDHAKKIQAALKELTEEQKACMILKSIHGLKYQEIAECLNININAVRSRLKRAREKLISIKKGVLSHEMR